MSQITLPTDIEIIIQKILNIQTLPELIIFQNYYRVSKSRMNIFNTYQTFHILHYKLFFLLGPAPFSPQLKHNQISKHIIQYNVDITSYPY